MKKGQHKILLEVESKCLSSTVEGFLKKANWLPPEIKLLKVRRVKKTEKILLVEEI